MNSQRKFSEPIELPKIPDGPGVCKIEYEHGTILQIAYSKNIRRRIGELFDSEGKICVHGPKIYEAQQNGRRVFVRWKLTPDYITEKHDFVEESKPVWG